MLRLQICYTTMLRRTFSAHVLVIFFHALYFPSHSTADLYADVMGMIPSTPTPPIDLRDIGYNGTWDSFCDPEQIEKDFPLYPERELHELRIMRIVLCEMKMNNSIARITLPAFAGYKYCEMMRPQAEDLLKQLFDRLSRDDPGKREELLTHDISNQSPFCVCFDTAENAISDKCIHKDNAYFRMFRPLIARACAVDWLKTEDILEGIEEVCQGKYMSGKGVDWNQMMNDINFKDEFSNKRYMLYAALDIRSFFCDKLESDDLVGKAMTAVELFYQTYSPPCRAVLTVLTLLNVPHDLRIVDLSKEEQFLPEILELNPQHTIPFLRDNGTIIIDSHVINAYLVEKYAKNKDKKLYPEDPVERAIVDHKLHYDTGVLFSAYRAVKRGYVPYKDITGITPEIIKEFEDIYNTVERFLKKNKYIAGNYVTIADISFYVSLTTMAIIWSPKEQKFPLTVAYVNRCGTDIKFLKSINEPGLEAWRKIMEGFKFTL